MSEEDKDRKQIYITPDKPCCDVWPEILHNVVWFSFVDSPDMLALPCLKDRHGESWKVNFCPACGKSIAGKVITRTELEYARGDQPPPRE